ncbi:MAG: cell division protein FtsZ [Saprospiraceae bacterium]|nr:cell division protein FtsZ [Saprospiraceae bacterium]
MQFDIPREERSIIKVIGVGGGGSNAVTHMFKQGIIGVDFAICNTDNQSMELSPVTTKIQLGPHLTEGRGAGSLPTVGKQACIESIDDVRRFVEEDTKMLFITAGMGGGTGTGAAPIIAKASKEMDILTVAIVTIPFKFEGKRRKEQAAEGLEDLKQNVDSLIIVSNDKLREIHGNLPISDAFANADDILSTAAKGIAEIITVPGYVNVDFEDVNTVMRDSGVSIMGTSIAEGEGRARKAVDEALNSPLLEDNDIRGAKHILINISSGTAEVTMDEIYEITEYVQDEAGEDTDLIWGNCFDETLGEKICVTVIATGFDRKKSGQDIVSPKKEQIIVSLEDDRPKDKGVYDTGYRKGEYAQSFDLDLDKQKRNYGSHIKAHGDPYLKAQEKQDQGDSQLHQQKEALRQHNKRLNNPQAVIDLENEPAYLRRRVELDDVPHSSEVTASRWSISGDDEPQIRKDNPYLHDNVD